MFGSSAVINALLSLIPLVPDILSFFKNKQNLKDNIEKVIDDKIIANSLIINNNINELKQDLSTLKKENEDNKRRIKQLLYVNVILIISILFLFYLVLK